MITTNVARIGNFTSSEIYRLLGTSQVAMTYVNEKNLERMLLRSLDKEESARPMVWGSTCEAFINSNFNLLGLNYKHLGDITKVHPEIPYWGGSADGEFDDEQFGIVEIKSPYTLKSFCNLVLAMETGDIQELRKVKSGNSKVGEQYYFQMVSNAILHGVDWAEFIVYMPFEMEIEALKEFCGTLENLNEVAWLNWSESENLPHLKENGRFKNLNKLRFEILKSDKILLENAVIKYGRELIEFYKD